MLWVATPSDWYVRLPGKRAGPHYQRIANLMVKARALRMSIVLMGPPGYFWKLGPIRDAIEDLGMQTMRMRFCHFGIKFDRASRKPSGTYIQIAITCTRIPVNLWKCNCHIAGKPALHEHELYWYGHNAARAEWRNKTLATLTARLIDQIDKHKPPRQEKSVVHLSVHTRIDKGVKTYVQSPKNGPQWDHVVRRVTTNLEN